MQTSASPRNAEFREPSRAAGIFDRVDRRIRVLGRTSPYALIALSAGAGFLLGSRSRSRSLAIAVGIAARFVASELIRKDPFGRV